MLILYKWLSSNIRYRLLIRDFSCVSWVYNVNILCANASIRCVVIQDTLLIMWRSVIFANHFKIDFFPHKSEFVWFAICTAKVILKRKKIVASMDTWIWYKKIIFYSNMALLWNIGCDLYVYDDDYSGDNNDNNYEENNVGWSKW